MNVYLQVLCFHRCSGMEHCVAPTAPEPDLGGNPRKSLQTTRETGFIFGKHVAACFCCMVRGLTS